MSESSEGVSANLEQTMKPFIPVKAELVPIELPNGNKTPATELPISNPERQRPEAQESVEGQKERESLVEIVETRDRLVSDKRPSFTQRAGNIFVDTRLRALTSTVAKTWGIVLATDIVASAIGYPHLATYAVLPILAYTLYETGKAVFGGGIKLGQFTNLFREYNTQDRHTPVGTIHSGDLVGSIHLMNSIGRMSDMSTRERALAVPLDGLRGLDKLRGKFEQNSNEVKDLVAIKASSHLVAQNRDLFTGLGFSLKEQSPLEKSGTANKVAGKIMILPIWGIRQLFRERSLRGFREANSIRLGETQTAWITPQTLLLPETKIAIDKNIQRIEPVLQRLRDRTPSAHLSF